MKKAFVLCLLCLLAAGSAPAQIRFALRTEVLNLTNSMAQPGGVPVPLTTNTPIVEILNWAATPTASNTPGEFLLQLRRPMRLGSIITYEAGTVAYQTNGQWTPLPPGADAGRKLQIIPFPTGVMIEAVKITVPAQIAPGGATGKPQYQAVLAMAALLPVRVVNVAQTASVKVSGAETTSPELRKTRPWLNQPETLVDGFIDAHKNFSTTFFTNSPANLPTNAAPLSATNSPSTNAADWILLSWPEPHDISGVVTYLGSEEKGFAGAVVEVFRGAGNPLNSANVIGPDWEVMEGMFAMPGKFRDNQFFIGNKTVTTPAIRFRTRGRPQAFSLGEIVLMKLLVDPRPSGPTRAPTNTIPLKLEPIKVEPLKLEPPKLNPLRLDPPRP